MHASWAVEYLLDVGAVDRPLADLVERLSLSVDAEVAGRLGSLIELRVAPPSGGVSDNASAVVTAVIANLPTMGAAVHPSAVALLAQIAGSLLHVDPIEHEGVKALVAAVPGIAALAQRGDAELQAEFVDFAALCAALDGSVAGRVTFYLQRLVEEVGGDIGASAQVELEHLRTS